MSSDPVTPPSTTRTNTNQPSFESEVTGVTASYVEIGQKKNIRTLALQIETYITSYLSITPEAVTAETLYAFHTWMLALSDVTPYLHILAPERESGKSTQGYVLAEITANALEPGYITGAALRRILDSDPPPTLILDEIDLAFAKRAEDSSDLHQALNLGWRRGALATMAVPPLKGQGDWRIKHFPVFGPKILIGVGTLPNSIESRSIQIRMERKPKGEAKKKWRDRLGKADAAPIHAALSMLEFPDNLPIPEMPEDLSGRQQDVWEPLFAIAEWIGAEWPAKVREAALSLHARHEDDSPGAALLRCIREIFSEHTDSGGLYSHLILRELLENEEWPWPHSESGRPLDVNRLAARLRPFGIRPTPIRVGGIQQRGYSRSQFEDAWSRYL